MKRVCRLLGTVLAVFFVLCFPVMVRAAEEDGWEQEYSDMKRDETGELIYETGMNPRENGRPERTYLWFFVRNAVLEGAEEAVFTSSNPQVARIDADSAVQKLRVTDIYCNVYFTFASCGTARITGTVGGKEYHFTVVVAPYTYAKIISVDVNDYKSIRLNWEKVTGATGYLIARAEKADGNLKELQVIQEIDSPDQLSAVLPAEQNVEYGYCVIPKLRAGNKDYYKVEEGIYYWQIDAMAFYKMSYKDAKITGITPGDSKVTLKWKANPSVKYYKIYSRPNLNASWKLRYTEKNPSAGQKTLNAEAGKASIYKVEYVFPEYTTSSKGRSCYVPKKTTASKKEVKVELDQSEQGGQYGGNSWVSRDETFYYEKGNTLHAVCRKEQTLIDYTLNTTGKIKAKRRIRLGKFDYWGGFYRGTDGCFYVTVGYSNPKKSMTKTVIKVMKYSASWKLQKTCKVKGEEGNVFGGIVTPFKAGNCRMELKGTKLYVATSRIMFYDGHQSNISFVVDTKTMKYKMANEDYTSHSFNQYVDFDADNLYLSNHGDAYSRAVDLTVVKNYGTKEQTIETVLPFKIKGEQGVNYTGLTEGGMKTTADNVIIAGTSVPQGYKVAGVTGNSSKYAQNVFVTITNKETLKTKIKWLTTYNPKNTKVRVGEVRMVKLSDDRVAVMFTTTRNNKGTLHYVVLNNEGTVVLRKKYSNMEFSASSQPILSNGGITWLDKKYTYEKMNFWGYTFYGVTSEKNYLYWIPALVKK